MSALLCFNRFLTANPARNNELNAVFRKTMSLRGVKKLVSIDASLHEEDTFTDDNEITVLKSRERPTYKSWITAASTEQSARSCAVLVICNSDIFIPKETIDKFSSLSGSSNCYALTRWDVRALDDDSLRKAVFFEKYHTCSQDVWVIPLPLKETLLASEIDFPLGVWGCDNRFCYELKKAGYHVTNPSRTLRTYHFHTVQLERKTHEEEHVDGPYLSIGATRFYPQSK